MSKTEREKNGVQPGKALAPTTTTDINLQRQNIQNHPGYSLADSIGRLQKIANGKVTQKEAVRDDSGKIIKYKTVPVRVPVSAMVAAENSIETKMGWKAAEKIEITQHSLLLNFNDLSSDDLKALQGKDTPAKCVQ